MNQPLSASSIFRQRSYVLFLAGRLLANIAAQMQTVAVGWLVYQRTGNALDLGWVGLSQFAPFILLTLPAGQVADRFDRRRVLAICYVLQAVCALLLWRLTTSADTAVWPIFATLTLTGISRAFAMPATQSLLPNLVPPALLNRAIAMNAAVFQSSSIAGPMLGGLAFLGGASTVFALVSLCALLASAAIFQVHAVKVTHANEVAGESWKAVLSGLRFVFNKPMVLGAMSLDLFGVLFGGATALLPIFASDVLHVGPAGLGMLRAATGVGAVGCAAWLALHPIQRHAGAWLFGSVIAFGFSTVLFGLSTNFWLSLFALAALGATDMLSIFVRSYLVQVVTPDDIRGRVSAVNSVFIGASNELGEFESGVTAAWWGAVPAVIVGGVATIAISLLWIRLFPSLRTLDRFPATADQR